jgi:hypothetical protein
LRRSQCHGDWQLGKTSAKLQLVQNWPSPRPVSSYRFDAHAIGDPRRENHRVGRDSRHPDDAHTKLT